MVQTLNAAKGNKQRLLTLVLFSKCWDNDSENNSIHNGLLGTANLRNILHIEIIFKCPNKGQYTFIKMLCWHCIVMTI